MREPYRQTIETTEGALVAERRDPAVSFAGLTRQSPWDEFQVAYFAGEANWNYFTAPFILARSDFVTEEPSPSHEDGQTWRGLLVTYPDSIVAHTKRQTYYSDDAGLLRPAGLLRRHPRRRPRGPLPCRVPGVRRIMVLTRRRVYVRKPRRLPRPRLDLNRHQPTSPLARSTACVPTSSEAESSHGK
jgi:hypothetical protein